MLLFFTRQQANLVLRNRRKQLVSLMEVNN